jgi:hypothetical protein
MTEETKDIEDQEIDLEEGNQEELEQIDELSPGTLGNYIKKATQSKKQHKQNVKDISDKATSMTKGEMEKARGDYNRSVDKTIARSDGVKRAINKLTKEEVEETGEYMEEDQKDFDATQDIDAIFSGEGLSEEFKSNAKAIFEAAVLAKVDERAQALQEEYDQKLEEEIAAINENVVSKVDEYLEYVVTEWMEENQLAVDSGIRSEITEDFMNGLKTLFQEHYIDIPEEKVDMVEELAAKVEALEGELDKAITENTSLTHTIGDYKKSIILDEISEGLTDVQAAKLASLAENIEFVSEEDYKEKVSLTKRKYFEDVKEEKVSSKEDQFASTEESLDESYTPSMAHYVKSISRTLKK